jgi:probable phosphoglycerate mutase
VWRHGQTLWNLEHRFQGSTDIPLDEVGIAQAARGASLLAGLAPSRIVSSPLSRASATADALATLTALPVAYDPRLVERFGGSWEGLTGDEIWARFPDEAGETLVLVSHGGAARCGIGLILGLPQEVWWRLGPLGNCSWSVLGEAGIEAPGTSRGWRLLEHNAGTLPEPVLSDDR